MSVEALEQIPAASLAILGTLVTVLIVCSLHALVQHVFKHETLAPHNEVAGVILTVVGTLYAVILGFVVVVVWQNFTTASGVCGNEANALAYVYRLGRGLPQPAHDTIRHDIVRYAQSVLTVEWPRMVAGGKSNRATGDLARQIGKEVVNFRPATPAEINLQAAMLSALGEFLNDRRTRLTYLESSIPRILWGVLVFGAIALLGITFLIGLQNRPVQLIMTAVLSAMIALSLVTIFELDSPLEGATHIEPVAWEIFAGQAGTAP
jgi:hypothetical protein